ncbi:hypothetical protein BK654_14805 [Pseudomonas brassicacearum]|nr:hypothetical protein BK654_14805 [Pseudomonas brassicacearum]
MKFEVERDGFYWFIDCRWFCLYCGKLRVVISVECKGGVVMIYLKAIKRPASKEAGLFYCGLTG